ncbi:MAG: FmdB family transcriptional regulator [Chloroflexi bacterium]|nr:FmdB family transcriptional regulator [Chloroflexota bacterium]MCL5107639.1 FmdB family transcriptional regulator [Chloroflexota bacterium]
MPLYEYECRQCGTHFERRQSVHDEPVKECPGCAGEVRRVLFPVGIIFKGSGFYVTDSRRPQPIGDNGDNGKAKSEGNGKTESKSSPDNGKASSESTSSTKVETAGAKS